MCFVLCFKKVPQIHASITHFVYYQMNWIGLLLNKGKLSWSQKISVMKMDNIHSYLCLFPSDIGMFLNYMLVVIVISEIMFENWPLTFSFSVHSSRSFKCTIMIIQVHLINLFFVRFSSVPVRNTFKQFFPWKIVYQERL